MAEGDAILHERAARIGSARVHSLRHGCNAAAGGASIEGHFTANAAHFSSGPEWCPTRKRLSGAATINAYEVRLVPLPLRQAIRRYDGLEKRSQNRLLKASDQIRVKRSAKGCCKWVHVTAKAIFPG
jgi:hypothetical protein